MSNVKLKKITTTPLTIRPRRETPEHKETVTSLSKMKKREICDLSMENFGVELKLRNTKADLIAEFIRCQDEMNL